MNEWYIQDWAGYTFYDFIDSFDQKITKTVFSIWVPFNRFFKIRLYLCCFLRYYYENRYTDVAYKDVTEDKYSFMLSNFFQNGGHVNILTWNVETTVAQIQMLQECKYFWNQFIFHMTPCLLKSVAKQGRLL